MLDHILALETNDISIDRFTEIALLVKEFDPALKSKQEIDLLLLRCFHLDRNTELKELLYEK